MHMNGNAHPPSNGTASPPRLTNGNDPDSDFEIEDDALLGTPSKKQRPKKRWTSYIYHVWERTYTSMLSTKWGRTADSYFQKFPKRLLFLAALLALFILAITFARSTRIHRTLLLPKNPFCSSSSTPGSTIFRKKPSGMKIYGLVFYGRRHTVEILDCYLRKNLVKNGGWLDEIHFLINTPVQEDLDWIASLLPQVPEYRGIYMAEGTDMRDFESVWRQGLQHSSDDLYVKVDDDLVYLSPTAIEEVVTSLLTHPEAFIVLGNLIDSAALGWVHHHHGAINSYLPEQTQPSHTSAGYGPLAWRDSELPTYPSDYDTERPFFDSEDDWAADAPYPHHRWLPLRDNQTLLPITPIWKTEYHANSFDWSHWQLGAQQHYSFLHHLEDDSLEAYHFGHRETGLWNMRFMHANINLMAVWANDILEHLPFSVSEDDEAHFSITLPAETKRQCYIQTRAIASHFSFGPQGGMYETDLLARYRAYANEHVCREVGMHVRGFEEWPSEGGGSGRA